MKHFLVLLTLMTNVCVADAMKGFGARYYDKDTEHYSDTYRTDKDLIPNIVIGSHTYKMESSTLINIATDTGVEVNKDNQANWICLKSQGVNYWFISDNEIGGGDLTTIAIAKDGSDCIPFEGKINVSIKNTPLLAMSKKKITSYFSHEPVKDIVMYYKEVKTTDEYTQGNSIQYFLKGEHVQGLFISQGTTN